ncbi:Sodium:solute symporter family-domain-containing protein [Paraphysoderma sedebokerense]|nr:Sodium:solute symporter family-domain-containing protein [Paraphysoderma sedebokerense]
MLLIFLTAIFVSYKERQKFQSQSAETQYFLSGRNVSWWAIAGSVFAANIGVEHFVMQAGSGAATGMAVSLYEWTASYLLFFLGWVLSPIYLGWSLMTIPEFFERRFSKKCRLALASINMLSYIMTKISATIFAGAILLETTIGLDLYLSVALIVGFTALYTISGGLSAVIYTDCMQMLIYTTGGIIATILVMNEVGGWNGIKEFFDNKPEFKDYTHVVRSPLDKEYAWTGMFIGQMIGSLWYWTLDNEFGMRVLCAKGLNNAKGGTLTAGFLKILPPFMIVLPGMATRIFYEKCKLGQGYESWCETRLDIDVESNKAYPYLLMKFFPTGLTGLMFASMAASMMSALSASFHSASAVFSLDLYHTFINPQASPRKLVKVGRMFTIFIAILSILWLFVIKNQNGQLYQIIQNTQTHLAPPLSTVALLGIFIKRINGPGAFAGIISGFLLGMIQYIFSLITTYDCASVNLASPLTGSDGIGLNYFVCMHFNHFAILIALFVSIVTIGVSYCYPPPSEHQVQWLDIWKKCLTTSFPNTSLRTLNGEDESVEEEVVALENLSTIGKRNLMKKSEADMDLETYVDKNVRRNLYIDRLENRVLNIGAVVMLGTVTAVIYYFR